jgi:hypothetical protein
VLALSSVVVVRARNRGAELGVMVPTDVGNGSDDDGTDEQQVFCVRQ